MAQSVPLALRDIDKEHLLEFLLRYATTQTSVGVQTSRIVVNTTRIAHAYGYELTIMMFQRNIAMTLTPVLEGATGSYQRLDYAHPVTGMSQHKHSPLNFYLNAELSRLSWYTYDNHPDLDELEARFERILTTQPVNRWLVLYLISQANMCLCLLFGGDLVSSLFVFLGAFLASFVVGLGAKWGLEASPEIALGASVLYLIPGVPFINGIMDLLDGYMLNGLSRLMTAAMIVVSITVGLSCTLLLLGLSLL